jgi:putative transposase
MYNTQQIRIKKGHRFYEYCDRMTFSAKNLFNATNFHIRQVFTAFDKEKEMQPLQKEVFDLIDKHLPQMNEVKIKTVEKKREKESKKPINKRKDIKDGTLFECPTSDKKFVGYGFLDGLFKASGNKDYLALPGQVNQQVMRVVFQNWKSFLVV